MTIITPIVIIMQIITTLNSFYFSNVFQSAVRLQCHFHMLFFPSDWHGNYLCILFITFIYLWFFILMKKCNMNKHKFCSVIVFSQCDAQVTKQIYKYSKVIYTMFISMLCKSNDKCLYVSYFVSLNYEEKKHNTNCKHS